MSVADKYQALSDIEHALLRPGMYIGSCESIESEIFIANIEDTNIVKKKIMYNAGLIRIYEEILLNAFDHTVRDPTCTEIRVDVDQTDNSITVLNNGTGIPVVIKKELGIYVPEMLFGMLRSGSNFDDSEKRTTGGTNGVGASLAVLFSNEFTIDTVDAQTKKHYVQTWKNNMGEKSPPTIKSAARKKPYTKVFFKPDLARFGVDSLTDDLVGLIKRRLIDIGYASSAKVKTFFNGVEITIKKPEDYIKLYSHPEDEKIIIDDTNERWSVGVVFSESGFQHVSFVNGIYTNLGGTHVDNVANQISKEIIAKLATKKIVVKPSDVKNKMFLFVRSTIENPTFNSQTKECLTTPKSKYGSEFVMSDAFKKKILASTIFKSMTQIADDKQLKDLTKTSGTKTSRLCDIDNLEDATWAGTKNSLQTKLILTEGLSARTFAMSALNVIGREKYGVFPLRGKLLNVRNVSITRVSDNEEIKNIVKIIGLKYELKYDNDNDMKTLRYGGVVSLCDSDVDGSHINGLILNYFHNFWPALIERGFINYCITPIVKVFKGDDVLEFYTLHSYEEWVQGAKGSYKTKYFKGLGTSTAKEAREALNDIDNKLITFQADDQSDNSISLAFNSKRADDRKDWLLNNYDPASCIDRSQRQCDVSDFINHELIHFSTYDCDRSIPSILDGFKTSQRKIMFVSLKFITKNEMKVGQLAPKTAELTDYHHGEQSLCGAVINMAQTYVGSNNVNLLEPHGAFGTRLCSGSDAASPRYIFTQLSPVAMRLFDQRDNCLLTHLESDGTKIEPEHYIPVLPMILINGALGIGTGFSTSVLKYNPRDIAKYIKTLLADKKPKSLMPWYRGFTGEIKSDGDRKYITYAVWAFDDSQRILKITDLPIGVWTDDYKKFCEKLLTQKDSPLEDVVYGNTDTVVDFRLIFKKDTYALYRDMDAKKLVKDFKLSSKLSETNMYLFNKERKLQYFETVYDIIAYYFDYRLEMYGKRKEAMIAQLKYEMLILTNKAKFIEAVKAGKIDQRSMTEASLLQELQRGFQEDPRSSTTSTGLQRFEYLVSMSYRAFTNENAKKMKAAVLVKAQEIEQLEATTIQGMWNADIDSVIKSIDEAEKIAKDNNELVAKPKKATPAKRTQKASSSKTKTSTSRAKTKTA
jgi:DNA topoisomerase II